MRTHVLFDVFQAVPPSPPSPPPPVQAPPLTPPAAQSQTPQPPPPPQEAFEDETSAKARKYVKYAIIWLGLAILVYLGLAAVQVWQYLNYTKEVKGHIESDVITMFYATIGALLVFVLLALTLLLITKMKIQGGMKSDRWDVATDWSFFIGVPSLIFGLGAGLLLIKVNRMMREHPLYLKTLPPPKPVCYRCRNEVVWKADMNKWYCEHCKIYL